VPRQHAAAHVVDVGEAQAGEQGRRSGAAHARAAHADDVPALVLLQLLVPLLPPRRM